MYELEEIYSKKTYDEWFKTYPSDLRPTKVKPDIAKQEIWKVLSFKELFKCVTFLATMNKRLVLYYRGQPENWDLYQLSFEIIGNVSIRIGFQ